MDKAVIVEGLSKSYLISHEAQHRPTSMREAIAEFAPLAWKRLRKKNGKVESVSPKVEEFWALQDVTFEVDQGSRLGIIGANGAGKSTLLKILSRVTEPSAGRVRISGRVSSLLEVGTGFHPELTGRENIFLNGAILGMRRAEIRQKFQEIVDFAEIERFLDTPVKRYSSGMYVRLAFAVAAHLDPDVLILDEVLAVGDIRFQQKCFGKIREMGEVQGRTVILVTHSMAAARTLCQEAIFIESGRIVAQGRVDKVVEVYEGSLAPVSSFGRIDLRNWKNRNSRAVGALYEWAEISTDDASSADSRIYVGSNVHIRFGVRFDVSRVGQPTKLAVALRTSDGIPLANMVDEDSGFFIMSARTEEACEVVLRDLRLYPGIYFASLWVGSVASETWDCVNDCICFEVLSGGDLVRRRLPREAGLLFLTPEWARA